MCSAMPKLEKCMESLICLFHRYAEEDCDKKTLSKKELKLLLEKELPSYLKAQKNPKYVDLVMKELAEDKHGLVFQEFLIFVGKIAGNQDLCTSKAETDLEICIESMNVTFHSYALEDSKTLNKKELKKILEKELTNFWIAQKDPNTLDRIMNDLDQNKDDKLDFKEFFSFITGLSVTCDCMYVNSVLNAKKFKK